MIDIYDDSIIVIIKNNVNTSRDLDFIFDKFKLSSLDGEKLYLNGQKYDLKYGVSRTHNIKSIGIESCNDFKVIAYQIKLETFEEIKSEIKDEYEVIGYSPKYNILNNQYITEYGYSISDTDILCKAFQITYVNDKLNKISVKGGKIIDLYKELNVEEITEIKSYIVEKMYATIRG